MQDRVSFSGQQQTLPQVAAFRNDTVSALRLYYSPDLAAGSSRFLGYHPKQLAEELNERLDEFDRVATLALLSAVEATFRTDFLMRCYTRKRDPLSRAFRGIHRKKGPRTSLEEDILEQWQNAQDQFKHRLGDLKGALRYRHWLAHGRYWSPKLGQVYDFETVYELAAALLAELPLLRPVT